MRILATNLFALTISAAAVASQPPTVVRPIDGYGCMRLRMTEQQARNPNGAGVYIQSEPADDAPHLLLAPSVIFARMPHHAVSGYLEVLSPKPLPDGQLREGWVRAESVTPLQPGQLCIPSLMSNGSVGAG